MFKHGNPTANEPLIRGGWGFSSLAARGSVTALTLTRRFFSWSNSFDYFSWNQTIQTATRFASEQGTSIFNHLADSCAFTAHRWSQFSSICFLNPLRRP
jgi:hypothetical protein